jgi:hypothetical protein
MQIENQETERIRQLIWDGALTYEQLRLVHDNVARYDFDSYDLEELLGQLARKARRSPYIISSFVVYAKTDGQD